MGFKQSLGKVLTNFGKSSKAPTYVAMGIATAKGVFRPTFTMMDKKENYETKRYTALREGLTELIAIPVYYLSGVASDIATKKLAVPKNFIKKDLYNKFKSGDTSAEVSDAMKKAEELAKSSFSKIKTTTAFIGVALSALIIIPLVCSITIKPIMKGIEKRSSKKKAAVEKPSDVQQLQKPENSLNTFKGLYRTGNYGMKVGAL